MKEENELTRALQRRRKVVDAKGSKFEKEPVKDSSNAADVKWDESHQNQFTPRASHQKNAASFGKSLEEAAEEQASSEAPADPPASSPAVSSDAPADPPPTSPELTAPASGMPSAASTTPASSDAAQPSSPALSAQDVERTRADAAKAALLQPSDIAEKLPPMNSLPKRQIPSRLRSAFEIGADGEVGSGKKPATAIAEATEGPHQGAQAETPSTPSKNDAEAPRLVAAAALAPASIRVATAAAVVTSGTVEKKKPEIKEVHRGSVPPCSGATTPAPMPNALKTPAPDAGVERMVSTPLQQHQNGGFSDPMMWRAVVEGDVRRLEDFAARGVLWSGRLTDQNGHSIFWNAVAFQKAEVALWLLRRFPPDSADRNIAVDLGEVHARRKDSLLHLCMYFNDFTASAADLFRHVFAGGSSSSSQAPRDLVNHNGHTFLSIAAARLNFWAFRFVLSQAPSCVSILRKAGPHMPLEVFLRRVRETAGPFPTPAPLPSAPTEARLPAWCQFGRHAPRSASVTSASSPAFADLIVEVEDPKADGGVGRVGAHRVIVGSCSGKFDAQLRKLPAGEALRLDSLCCRSEEVLIAMMNFIYTGEVALKFSQDAFLLWQLLCLCVQYSLPAVLTTYTRTALVSSLRDPRYAAVMPVLLQAAEKVGLTQDEASFVAGMLLDSPQALDSLDMETRQAQAILAALTAVEKHVQGSAASSAASARAAAAAAAASAPVPSYAPAPTPLSSFREIY